jgi:CrcB protein
VSPADDLAPPAGLRGRAIGSGLRFLVTLLAIHWLGGERPYGTLAVNLAGSFAIGLVHEVALSSLLVSEPVRLFLATGVLGGFTTYSAFSYETVRLAERGPWSEAATYVVVTTAGCLALCLAGIAVGRQLIYRG